MKLLLEQYPEAASATDDVGMTPLHKACLNKKVFIRLLVEAAPDTVRSESNNGNMPLHSLCCNKKVEDAAALKILKLLMEKYPEAVRHANNRDSLPIHFAAGTKSPEFCRELIDAYPGSERITVAGGKLPFHRSCLQNTLQTVEYLYSLDPNPEAIFGTNNTEGYPV